MSKLVKKDDADAITENAPTRFVRLNATGVIACGQYRAGVVYEVSVDEAAHLIEHKGFSYAEADATAQL